MKKGLNLEMFQNYPDVLTAQEVQQALRIGRAGVYKLLASGALECFKLGNTYRIPKDSLISYMNLQCKSEVEGGDQK